MKAPYFNYRKISFCILFSLFFLVSKSQIKYCYDADGNRTQRLMVGNVCRKINIKDTNSNNKDSAANNTAEQHGIGVYPNPTMSSINVNVSNLQAGEEATIYLYDTKANTLYSTKASIVPVPINMQSYSAGTYFVKVVIGKDNLFYRVIKTQ